MTKSCLALVFAILAAVPAVAAEKGIRVCPTCSAHTLQDALDHVRDGGVVVLAAGTYRQAGIVTANRVTIRGEPGAHLRGMAADGKAALVAQGNDTVIEGIECSHIRVDDGNGACVRLEGRNLTLRRVYFHDSEEGVLTANDSGTVLVEDSRFERLGNDGQAHGLYIGHSDSLTIRRSSILSSVSEGHEVKSRAARTVIEDSVIASLDGVDSRLVDVCNGGEVVIRNSVLEKGPASSNHELIGYGLEGMSYTANSLRLEGNTIIVDHPYGTLMRSKIKPVLGNGNLVVGGRKADEAAWHPDRAAAGLKPYPALPEAKEAVRP
ncbi:MAG TPA: right-handed parallel beta-helix repeat-containing protein [Magnetospirillum sp.]|jgi:hypothetical protein|nr:right-handed parallel beta-helix repeat-containing protein [Magnetospirillum sp.]